MTSIFKIFKLRSQSKFLILSDTHAVVIFKVMMTTAQVIEVSFTNKNPSQAWLLDTL